MTTQSLRPTASAGDYRAMVNSLRDADTTEEVLEAIDKFTSKGNATRKAALVRAYGGDSGSEPQIPAQKATGAQLNPVAIGQKSLTAMYRAFKDRQPNHGRVQQQGNGAGRRSNGHHQRRQHHQAAGRHSYCV